MFTHACASKRIIARLVTRRAILFITADASSTPAVFHDEHYGLFNK